MSFIHHITHLQLDSLKEIGNIGAGNAATALSRLLNKKVDMKVPDVRIVSFDEMMEMAGGTETVVAIVFFRIEGDAPGSMFFLLPLKQASSFISQLTGEETNIGDQPYFSELASSALKELSNILAGSYLSALSDFTHLNIYPSIPYLAVDMAGAVISQGLIEISHAGDYAIVINTALHEEDGKSRNNMDGQFYLIPDPESFEIIFKALGVNENGSC
ncbi:chemotaxis protein CheC [Peribacillus deserti]|uniref:CheY-P-specific phosphatase CheC n=1 Tax=Peribacillus deserti TaxID=673318 RepID=A0A2N5MB30_9BACI|nr:chemotaxis protein CheC [Peribacillus deserti]PLT31569.1 CheY-P-specific phosphatase CheC [Peribacillus deserti]